MIDRMFYKFFAWIDSLYQKVEDVWTFDIGEKLPKKKRKKKVCKDCKCKCHCKDDLHLHNDQQDLCVCDNCKCK
jgi:hypothetical protein